MLIFYASDFSRKREGIFLTSIASKIKKETHWLLLLLLQISRLVYTNSGNAILALASNGIHLLWRWQRVDHGLSAKVRGLNTCSNPVTHLKLKDYKTPTFNLNLSFPF